MRALRLVPLWAGVLALTSIRAAANPYGEIPIPFEVEQVDDLPVYYTIGYSGVPDSGNAGHTSNAGFVITDDGVVVFDTLGTPALGWRLLQAIRERTDKPVRYVVISHYHADHIYGLQAFADHTDARIIAQEEALQYLNPRTLEASEDARRRLAQRREALFPWVDENTRLVAPDETFDDRYSFELGGLTFELVHAGPAHAPGDSMMIVPELGIVFSGDVIYNGRIPFLDSPEVDSSNWLDALSYLQDLEIEVRRIIPGHGKTFGNVDEAVAFTKRYIGLLRERMGEAVQDFAPFSQAYADTDWSAYEDMPAFDASNRGNAYRIYLELEAEQFE
ncbi:MAG: MBL fold metallo-hydrolase [Chromatiales bacterium]|jgi:glyoxylase-like metal-dependent hydrolase (beta-lactamase superfamily II)